MESHSIRQKHAQNLIAQLNKSGSKILGVVRNNISDNKRMRKR
jgi:Mrp family chromosome partitioning ATPase